MKRRPSAKFLPRPPAIVGLIAVVVAAACAGCDRRDEQGGGKSGGGSDGSNGAAAPVVVISGDTAGWITPCGCAANQSGGLLRRATWIEGLRKNNATLYLDAGGAPGGDSDYHREKFEAILRGEKLLGIAAHNLGQAELALGVTWLLEVQRRLDVPLLCANVVDDQHRPVFSQVRTVSAGGFSLSVIGVVSQKLAPPAVRTTDPRQAVLNVLAAHRPAQASPVLVLAYAPEEELMALAASLPEVDAIIGGPTGQALSPRRAGPVLVASSSNKGKFLVRLDAAPRGQPWKGDVVEIGPSFADHPAQSANLAEFLRKLEQADFPAVSTGLVEGPPPSAPVDYRVAGSAACVTCHSAEHESWTKTAHHHAMQTLQNKGSHVDPYCQSCHTTGFAMPGGFDRLSTGTLRFDVGCESCHGPSQAHVKDVKRRTSWRAADQCVRCHDHENSPKFDYAAYYPRIAHGKNAAQAGSAK